MEHSPPSTLAISHLPRRGTTTNSQPYWGEADYREFAFKAVVDYVEVDVELRRSTNGGIFKNALQVARVVALNKGPGSAATRFTLHISEPERWHDVHQLVSRVESDYGLIGPPVLRRMEVAFDAYHRAQDPGALLQITRRFFHMSVGRCSDNMRAYRKTGETVSPNTNPAFLADKLAEGFNIAIGEPTDPLSLHMYVKRTDRNGSLNLPADDHRARSELQLSAAALPVALLQDASAIRFEAFARWFRFRKVKAGVAVADPFMALLLSSTPHPAARSDIPRNRRHFDKRTEADRVLTEIARQTLKNLTGRMNHVPRHIRSSVPMQKSGESTASACRLSR